MSSSFAFFANIFENPLKELLFGAGYAIMNWKENAYRKRRDTVKLIVCLDDDAGMMFNHRRQSRDRVLIADMIRLVGESPLWVSPYSARLFDENCPNLRLSATPAQDAAESDYCFIEDTPLPKTPAKIDELVIYRWNRLYPSDVRFSLDTSAFFLAESTEFAGSSHDNITKEIWKK